MELWTPPHDAPHLLEWWRPLMLVSRRARLDRFPWPVHLDEFRLAGRVVRKGRADIWIYEHHENGGSVCVDATGATYKYTETPRSKSPGRFTLCDVRTALWRARLPDVVEPIWYEEQRRHWEAVHRWDDTAVGRGGEGFGYGGPVEVGDDADDAAGQRHDGEHERDDEDGAVAADVRPRVIRRGHLTLIAG